MSYDDYSPHGSEAPSAGRPPRCYTRARAEVMDRSGIVPDDNTIVVVLAAVTCTVAFLVVYGGWAL